MYTNKFQGERSRGSSSRNGNSRPGGSRGGFSRNRGGTFSSRDRFRGRGSRRSSSERIDFERFINKAEPNKEEEKYVSTHTFEDFNLNGKLLLNLKAKGYEHPMPIQDQTIPQLLEGKDLIGIANTGTGKTAAFLIPLIQKTLLNNYSKTLIIAPTRELAEQIREELFEFTQGMGIFSVLVIGGASMGKQIFQLGKKYNFVIGTPGRLRDLHERRALNFNQFNNIVLDEVDRMFDMGFSKEIIQIMDMLPEKRQSLFFSATITPDVDRLIKENSQNPVRVSVAKRETTASVDQDVVRVVDMSQKIEMLHDLLIQEDFEKILVFGKTKSGVNKLSYELQKRGFKADSIHGDKSQSQRQRALTAFKQGRINILVATDVAARGLDIPDVTHVINYELPDTYADYIHRIGRTGRANKVGKSLTFIPHR